MKKLAVIGAGPTAIGLIHTLVSEGALSAKDIVILDPQAPLAQFGEHVGNIGMKDMRSPWTVSVTRGRDAFYRFAEERGCEPHCYTRPPWHVFAMHARHVWGGLGVERVNAKVIGLSKNGRGWELELEGSDSLSARRVVVATGLSAHRIQPFDNAIPIPDQPLGQHAGQQVAVIGAGMTATNAAFTLLQSGAKVVLFAPEGLKTEHGELNAWITGPQGDGTCISEGAEDARKRFIKLDTPARYRTLLTNRIEGTVTEDHREIVWQATQTGQLAVLEKRVTSVDRKGDGLTVKTYGALRDGKHNGFNAVYDARGFRPNLDAVPIKGLREAVGQARIEELPLIDDRTGAVQGQPTLYIAGALSAMSFGPAASTLAGGTMLGHVMAQHGDLR